MMPFLIFARAAIIGWTTIAVLPLSSLSTPFKQERAEAPRCRAMSEKPNADYAATVSKGALS